MKKQLLKKGVKEFIKTTKNNDKELFSLRSDEGDFFWVHNGFLLTTRVFNLKYAVKHEKLSITSIKNDMVYNLSKVDTTNKERIFNI